MSGPVVATMSIALDGYGAGPHQSEEQPLGEIAEGALHGWMFDAADENGEEIAAITDAGAYVMGRNVFGPVRGEWSGDWRGWWGPNPPYHAPVFVLTHHPREPLEMEGGTTFHFVADGVGLLDLEHLSTRATSRTTHVRYRVRRPGATS